MVPRPITPTVVKVRSAGEVVMPGIVARDRQPGYELVHSPVT
jgi:hypothetical protein